MPCAVLGLGSNLGARRALLSAAAAWLDAQPGCRAVARSSLYETPPLGPPQPDYLNAALRVEWVGSLEGLFALTRHLELLLGRERRERWGPRTLDVDILWWSEGVVRTDSLEVPHPGLLERNFALAPLLEVLPEQRAAWEAELVRLGGPPALAIPGWLELSRQGPVTSLTAPDEAELAALLVSAVAELAGSAARPCSTLPFRVSEAGEAGLLQLLQQVIWAQAAGFVVHSAAVVAASSGVLQGVLLGEQVGGCVSLPGLEVGPPSPRAGGMCASIKRRGIA